MFPRIFFIKNNCIQLYQCRFKHEIQFDKNKLHIINIICNYYK